MTRLGLTILWMLHFLPRRFISVFGRLMGLLFFALASDRRRVVAKNLELCFPKLSPRERARLRLKHFMSLGRAIADCSIVWWSKASSIKKLAKFEGRKFLIKRSVKAQLLYSRLTLSGLRSLGSDFR